MNQHGRPEYSAPARAESEATCLFVYGTLKRGEPNFERYVSDALTVVRAEITGRLYHLPQGYPGLVLEGDEMIQGEAMTFADLPAKLRAVDPLETCDPARPEASLYRRAVYTIFLLPDRRPVPAWVYVYARPLPEAARPVEGGDWRSAG